MRILSIVGARPQFVKAAAMCRAVAAHPDISDHIIHTGQHYDARMSDVFFEELGIPFPTIISASGRARTANKRAR